jgi:valyl-tRNA synthetase
LIYRGHRVVNWSVKGQSTCSDDELVYVERPAKLYTFKYSKDFPIAIASTRPETKLGDTAVAVHPKDKRYKKYIGQTFTVDVGAAEPLSIKIIADEGVDKDFGTGALGVTPAHSPIDYEMYERQKAAGDPIGLIQVIGADGKMTAAAGADYEGLTGEEAREKFVLWLRTQGLLEKEEDIVQNVGTSDRFKDVVEALPMTQWFVAVNKEIPGRGKTLKDLMREAVTKGHNNDPKQKVHITPDRFEKIYFNWINNLRDWCISRQIWWGHRIPVWYKGTELYCGLEAPQGSGWAQDSDTLDTWFSSGLWTFSTLGWPDVTKELKTFHPTTWMQMGYEILFFWVARMILMSTYILDQIPFHDVYIHGLVRNKEGKKFSKSDGNTLDPLRVIEQYGTDALRYSLIAGISPGNDLRFYEEKVV